MGIFNSLFPYTDFHRLNADWILEKVKKASDDAAEAAEDAAEAAETVAGFESRLEEAERAAEGSVRYDLEQDLNSTQQAQGRANIGAAASSQIISLGTTVAGLQTRATAIETNAVRADTSQSFSTAQQTQARNNISAASASEVSSLQTGLTALSQVAVQVGSAQSFTDAQKLQARQNIGAASVDAVLSGAVLYSASQVLSSGEKSRARSNIDALGNEGPTIIGGITMENSAGTARYQSSILSRSGITEWEFADPNNDPIIFSGVNDPQLTYDAANKHYVDSKDLQRNSAYSSSTPSITAVANTLYICGEVTSLTINSVPATGEITVRFQSGSTPATLALPADVLMPDDFAVEADRYYEINILDKWGLAASWEVEVVTP